jgi:DNA-binding GntR family transcriptional regulator
MDLTKSTEEEANALAIEPGDDLLSMVRLFFADERPAILANNVVPVSFLTCPVKEVNGELRIREILQRYCNQEVAFAITDIRSVLAGEAANALAIRADVHLLNLKMAFYSKANQPLALGNNYFNDNLLRLRLAQAWI